MITLEANYSKKLGLPGYSSHQYSLTIRKEVTDINRVEEEPLPKVASTPPHGHRRNLS